MRRTILTIEVVEWIEYLLKEYDVVFKRNEQLKKDLIYALYLWGEKYKGNEALKTLETTKKGRVEPKNRG